MRVRDLMSEPVISCRPDESLEQAVERMRAHEVGILPVLDIEGRIRGVLTERDLCFAAVELGKPLSRIRVAAAMTSVALVCGRDDSLEIAESIMQVNHVRRLPVVDAGGRVVGMLSLDDIAVEALRQLESGRESVSVTAEEVTRTFGEICRPSAHGHAASTG